LQRFNVDVTINANAATAKFNLDYSGLRA